MKKIASISLLEKEMPPLNKDLEGRLCGGFCALTSTLSGDNSSNGTCSSNRECNSNEKCSRNGFCYGGGNSVGNDYCTENKSCGNNGDCGSNSSCFDNGKEKDDTTLVKNGIADINVGMSLGF